jgi:hypothetical protein
LQAGMSMSTITDMVTLTAIMATHTA